MIFLFPVILDTQLYRGVQFLWEITAEIKKHVPHHENWTSAASHITCDIEENLVS